MAFKLKWSPEIQAIYDDLKAKAKTSFDKRHKEKGAKASKDEGLFKQVVECLKKLEANPRHPGLNTHKFDSMTNPVDDKQPVFESYVQNNTPGAWRLFWCYGPGKNEISLITLTPHP